MQYLPFFSPLKFGSYCLVSEKVSVWGGVVKKKIEGVQTKKKLCEVLYFLAQFIKRGPRFM